MDCSGATGVGEASVPQLTTFDPRVNFGDQKSRVSGIAAHQAGRRERCNSGLSLTIVSEQAGSLTEVTVVRKASYFNGL